MLCASLILLTFCASSARNCIHPWSRDRIKVFIPKSMGLVPRWRELYLPWGMQFHVPNPAPYPNESGLSLSRRKTTAAPSTLRLMITSSVLTRAPGLIGNWLRCLGSLSQSGDCVLILGRWHSSRHWIHHSIAISSFWLQEGSLYKFLS